MKQRAFDYVIVGAGIVGLTIARALKMRGIRSIAVFEKEAELGKHSSGRNSGVLHAGIYYSTESLKAKVCAEGSRRMKEYARERGIKVIENGKVIVASSPEETAQVHELERRAKANGARVELISENRLRELEPNARTFGAALYSPETAVIDSSAVLRALHDELVAAGIVVERAMPVRTANPDSKILRVGDEEVSFGHLVNAAGLQADVVASWFDCGRRYRVLPFRGAYRRLTAEAGKQFRMSIYPVPPVGMPFLGVHITPNVKGDVYIGPTAMPAFGREHYSGLTGIEFTQLPRFLGDLGMMILRNTDGVRNLVREELAKQGRVGMMERARMLAPGLNASNVLSEGKCGLRSQLYDTQRGRLEMDFVIEQGEASTHVLNAVSPAFSASMAFADMVLAKMPV